MWIGERAVFKLRDKLENVGSVDKMISQSTVYLQLRGCLYEYSIATILLYVC
jgi:hypothetical protein